MIPMLMLMSNHADFERLVCRMPHATSFGFSLLTRVQVAQCFLILFYTLSGINGSLVGFYVCVLIGSLFESLLCTYNIRKGPACKILAFIIFIFL